MTNIKITTAPDGRARVHTPYNADFVARIKTAGGRWDSAAKCWTVSADALDVVRAIMRDVYGMDDNPVRETARVRLTFEARVYECCASVTILGHTIARAFGRDSGARVGDGVYYEVGKPGSGGSVKNWISVVEAGSVVVLAAVPTALLDREDLPDGVTAEIIQPATIDRAALVAERERLTARIAEIDALLADA